MGFLSWLGPEGFVPRSQCGGWSQFDIWFYLLSDLAIFGAYVAIPLVLVFFARRLRELPFRHLFWLFAAFILSCGTTHLVDALMFSWPAYRLNGLIRFLTAVVSWTTVLSLIPVIPRALRLRSPEALEREMAARAVVEAELLATIGRFNAIHQSALDALITADTSGRIISVNKSAERIFGQSESWFKDHNVRDLMPLRLRELHSAGLASYLKTGEARIIGRVIESIGLRADGTEFPVELTLATWFTPAGEQFFTSVIRDVTERVEAQRKVQQQREDLAQQVYQRRLLEQEIVSLKDLRESQSAQLSATAQAIDKLNGVTANLQHLLVKVDPVVAAMNGASDGTGRPPV